MLINNNEIKIIIQNKIEYNQKQIKEKYKSNPKIQRFGKRKRKIKTEFGEIIFLMDRYRIKKSDGSYSYKILNEQKKIFGFFDVIYHSIKQTILQLSLARMTSTQIKLHLNKITISKSSINNIVKNNKLEIDNKFNSEKLNSNKIIYIEIDDCYQRVFFNKKKHKIRNRMIAIHLGKNKNNKIMNKKIILEQRLINQNHASIEELAIKIKSIIKNEYGINDPKRIFVNGDGARWIKSLAAYLNADYFLDFFHLKKEITKVFGYGKYNTMNKKLFHKYQKYKFKLSEQIKYLILTNNKVHELLIKLDKIKEEVPLKSKKIEIQNIIKYIKNNVEGINNYQKNDYIGSRTEAFISHYIKKITTQKFMTFSVGRLKNTFSNLNKIQTNTKYILI